MNTLLTETYNTLRAIGSLLENGEVVRKLDLPTLSLMESMIYLISGMCDTLLKRIKYIKGKTK